jgi:amino acid adenylation domain-containing protein/FkbM family methyltransferase
LCDAPADILTSNIRTQLANFKQEIINLLQKTHSDFSFHLQPITPVPRNEQPFPSSFAQERLWFFDQLEEKSATYNVPKAVRMTGDLNVSALKQAIAKIIDRHEVLRTHFPSVDGKPIQVIEPEATLQIVEIDWQHLPQQEQELQVQNYIQQEIQTPFDLSKGPLLRVTLLRLTPQESVLLITLHHIISDGWSLAVFVQELFALYQAYTQGKPSPLPELSVQYADFAVWQRQWLTGDLQHKQLQYWQQQLAGAPYLLALPCDRPRPPVQTYRGHTQTFVLDQHLRQQLEKLSADSGSTLFMTLLAAFAVLLFRYSGQEDLLIGSPIANRNHPNLESLIGFFVNTLVLRTRLQGNPSFAQLLQQVREVTLEAYEHQDIPFEQVVEALQPERSLSYSPLFQVMFVLQNIPMCPLELPGVSLTPLRLETQTAKFDLLLSMEESETGLVGSWEYSTDLFEASTIAQMASHYQTLLAAIVANPHQRIEQLPLLNPTERQQLLSSDKSCFTDMGVNQCIHHEFEAQVARTPDAIAVVFEEQQLTYQELNSKANQLAHYLITQGVDPEVLVGICVERSIEMIVGLLAILKAGGAYVPLDPRYPKDHLIYLLSDSKVPVLLTQSRFVDLLGNNQRKILCLDTEWETISTFSQENPNPNVSPHHLAYVIYTSGSTGKPKGVLVNHQNLIRLFTATHPWFQFDANDVWTFFHSYAFDFSVWEMWGALLYGGRLIIVPYWVSRDPSAFYTLLTEQQVTVLNQTPSAFRQLMRVEELADTGESKLSLRLVILGGEALVLPSLQPWFERHGDQFPQVVNMYGITETTVHVSYQPLTIVDLNRRGSIIGRPIPDLQVYILDKHLQPVPHGARGEMYIGGAGVVRGYLNRPELTAERFILNPFSTKPNTRLYKTGDWGRYNADGRLEYLERIDDQVKIRGFRLELGEIEAVLSQHPAVEEAVVVVREDEPDDKRLVAYIVPARQCAFTVQQLLRYEKEGLFAHHRQYELPNGMVIIHLNKNETDFVYQEIFEEQSYLRHGILINDGDCIFDVGANIGLFTLFIALAYKNVVIYAFEPIPPIFEVLRLNTGLYSSNNNIQLFDYGLSREAKQEQFTYYPYVSVISGCYANTKDEQEVIRLSLINQQKIAANETALSNEEINDLLTERLQSQEFSCHLKTISEVIRENGITQIDLLKIDVEKSELDVLAGIQEEDWQKIRQIVVEVHDIDGRLECMTGLLENHSYNLAIEQDTVLKDTGLYTIYAVRPSKVGEISNGTSDTLTDQPEFMWRSAHLLVNDIRQYIQAKLPEYMIPTNVFLLEKLPLTPSGKIDRKALPAGESQYRDAQEIVAPTTATEQTIANIFARVLKVPEVSIHDNFFKLGGHSLIATQVIAHLQQSFNIQLPLRTLFEHPTVAQLSQVLSQWEATESIPARPDLNLPTLTPAPEERYKPFPLTEIQQAYWLGRNSAFELGNIASHIYIELDCHNLDLERLNSAWQKIIDHHDMMRMVVLPDGQQQILPQVPPYQIEIFDLSNQSQPTQTRHLETIRQQMSHQVFDGETWPLFKLCATRLEQQGYRLHLSFDALIADALSLMNFGQQWWQLYQNPQATLPQLEASFRDYVLAELALRDTPPYQRAQDYWHKRLPTLPNAPELPLAQRPSTLKQPQFKRFSSLLTPQQWQQLQQKAHQANLTPSSLLLTAFSDILTTWSKSPHFTINLTLFHRLPLHPQVNQIVGDFTSLTLLEVNHAAAAPFRERAQRLQAQLWQDLDHRYVTGVAVQRQLRHQRGTSQTMGVVFTSTLGISDLTQQDWWVNQFGEMVYGITQTPQVWLDHQVIEEQGTLRFNWDVVEELFPPGMVDEMFSSYCHYLQQLVTGEQAWQETHPQLLPPQQLEQRRQVNQTETAIPEQTLDGLFIDQAQKQPTSLAVITPELTLTYEQLYQRALKLGHQLRQLGVTTQDRIAIVMEKGWEQVVALLGILMSGAAYVPIDPELPQQRQWSLLAEAQVQWVITQTSLSSKLSWPEAIDCLCVEDNPPTTALAPLEPLHQPRDLAYIIYTSGSTGRPKGVMIEHLAAVNTLIDINQRFGITSDDRVLAVSALNFDLSVYDILGILAAGGTMVLPSAGGAKDPAHWLSLVNAHQVTLWNSVPALMQMLAEYSSTQPTPINHSLRLVLLSGDWLPLNLPQQIQALWTDAEVISLGGATEASIWSIYYPIREVQPHWRSIPYGKPLGNQTVEIFNSWMTPTPVGVPGQIYIGGRGLARGYWQDEQKTAQSFITHPLTQERLYNTGDWGCYLPDGNIEFLGREDFQVKIRGYRIELGEIEATLMQHELVNKAVVLAVGDAPEKRQLVAYVVGSQTPLKLPEAYQPQDKAGMIVDPIERIEFKLKQPGLRRFASTQASVELPLEIEDEALSQAYLERQSYRQFQQQPLELQRFSQFLSCLRQLKLEQMPLPKYLYPSAGNLYPVQTYVLIKPGRVVGVAGGIYYYCPRQHRLVRLTELTSVNGEVYGANQPMFEQAAFALFLIAQLDAVTPMYGEMAQRFCFLEAGHLGQLLMSHAPKLDLGLCPIGDLDWTGLSEGFKLEAHQMLLYSFVGGEIDPTHKKQWLMLSSASTQADRVSQLRQYLQSRLPEYMLPLEYVWLDCLPLSANGKVDRQALPDSLLSSQQLQKNFVPPRDLVELKLSRIWSETLNVRSVGVQDNFFDLGGNSLFAIRLMTQIEQQFQRNLPLATLLQGQTIEKLATILRNQPDSISWSSLVPIQTSGYKRPFFCIAGGGGNVLYFYHLALHLGSDQPFYALQAVGLDGESEPLTRIEDMAAHYIEAIKSVQPQGPYLLGGHSFGGTVAFETAQQLQKQGDEVALLAILDMRAPDVNTANLADVNWDGARMLTRTASIFEHMFGKDTGISYEVLQLLTPEEQLKYVSERFQIANIFPPGVGTKQLRGLIRVSKINQQAHYVPQAVHPTRISLFRASEKVPKEIVGSEEIYKILYENEIDPLWGWNLFSRGEVELHTVPGDHLTMMTGSHVHVLATKLKACPRKSLTGRPDGATTIAQR